MYCLERNYFNGSKKSFDVARVITIKIQAFFCRNNV